MSATAPTHPNVPLDRTAQASPAINPWLFVPVLYFMQSVPNILVTESFVSIYKDMGVDNLKITFWTSIIGLPWTFKMFWGPLVDLNFTKRNWTIAVQVLITGTLVLIASVMTGDSFFWYSLAALALIAVLSATHDIACDGLYLMSLDKARQAAFSGVMGTFSRFGRLFATFGVLFVGGKLQSYGWHKNSAWAIAIGFGAVVYGGGMLWNIFSLPSPPLDVPAPHTEANQNKRNLIRTVTVILLGVCVYFFIASAVELIGYGVFAAKHGNTFDAALAIPTPIERTNALTALPKPVLPLTWNMTAGERNTQLAILTACAALMFPAWMLTRRVVGNSPMGEAFSTYFRQSGFLAILAFIMFYRFGEAMILKIVVLFLQGSRAEGGMGIKVEEVAQIYGIGVPLGLILGGLAGGAMISRVGLRRAFWPLVFCMHAPNLLYVLVAYERPDNHLWLYPVAFVEAFGYGFGFAGYFVYLMYVAQRGNFRTSHYAIGTGLGAMFITFAGILSGILQQALGYLGFFICACVMTIPGTLTLLFIPMDNEETRATKAGTGDH